MQVEKCLIIATVVMIMAAMAGLYTIHNFYGGPRCHPGWEEPRARIVFDACIIAVVAAAVVIIVLYGVYQEKKGPRRATIEGGTRTLNRASCREYGPNNY